MRIYKLNMNSDLIAVCQKGKKKKKNIATVASALTSALKI